MKRITYALAAFAAAISSAALSAAPNINSDCKFYFAGEPNVPPSVTRLMEHFYDSAGEACISTLLGSIGYWAISDVARSPSEICRFSRTYAASTKLNGDINERDLQSILISRVQRQIYMTLPLDRCPRQDDPRYIGTNGMSEGVYISLRRFVDSMVSSPRAFDVVFSQVPSVANNDYKRMQTDIAAAALAPRRRLKEISLDERGNIGGAELLLYHLYFGDIPGTGWLIDVDLTANGWRVVRFNGMGIQR